jgi:Bacterial regulatory proteins, luxR family
MAEGRSNAAIAQRLFVTERAVAKHTASIFHKLGLQPSDDDNRGCSPSSRSSADDQAARQRADPEQRPGQRGCALYAPGQDTCEHVSAGQRRTQQPSPEP